MPREGVVVEVDQGIVVVEVVSSEVEETDVGTAGGPGRRRRRRRLMRRTGGVPARLGQLQVTWCAFLHRVCVLTSPGVLCACRCHCCELCHLWCVVVLSSYLGCAGW